MNREPTPPGASASGASGPPPEPDGDLLAALEERVAPPWRPPPAVIDTRRYRWAIGGFGFLLVIAFSVYLFATRGTTAAGVLPGQPLHRFAAPLAVSTLDGAANADHPTCSPARHDPRAFNVCLTVGRAPLAIVFFVPGAGPCLRAVDALDRAARSVPGVVAAAIAVGGGHAETARLVRSRGWRLPVAYDLDNRVGALYGVAACPMLELARRGGIVAERLIGERWTSAATLAPHLRALLAPGGGAAG